METASEIEQVLEEYYKQYPDFDIESEKRQMAFNLKRGLKFNRIFRHENETDVSVWTGELPNREIHHWSCGGEYADGGTDGYIDGEHVIYFCQLSGPEDWKSFCDGETFSNRIWSGDTLNAEISHLNKES